MSNLEFEQVNSVAAAMSVEEKLIVVKHMPDYILLEELRRRLSAYDSLKEAVKGIQVDEQ